MAKMTNQMLSSVVVVLLLAGVVCAKAQDPSPRATPGVTPAKLALIKDLIELTSSKKTIDAMLKAQAEQMEKQMPDIIWQAVSKMAASLTPKQREELKAEVAASSIRAGRRVYDLILEKIDFNKLIEGISVPLYDKYFTENDLSELINFYKSPVGKKLIKVTPLLMEDSMMVSVEYFKERMPEAPAGSPASDTGTGAGKAE